MRTDLGAAVAHGIAENLLQGCSFVDITAALVLAGLAADPTAASLESEGSAKWAYAVADALDAERRRRAEVSSPAVEEG